MSLPTGRSATDGRFAPLGHGWRSSFHVSSVHPSLSGREAPETEPGSCAAAGRSPARARFPGSAAECRTRPGDRRAADRRAPSRPRAAFAPAFDWCKRRCARRDCVSRHRARRGWRRRRTSRISVPMYCIWRRRASYLVMPRASTTASRSRSGSSSCGETARAESSTSSRRGPATRALSCLRCVLLWLSVSLFHCVSARRQAGIIEF